MSADNFELVLRARMKSHAAELDRALRPAPRLSVVLSSGGAAGRRLGRLSLRLVLGVAAAVVLAITLVSGALPLQAPHNQPVASISPSTPASPSSTQSLATPPSRASPTPAPSITFEVEPLAS
jgi:hypothetical protein